MAGPFRLAEALGALSLATDLGAGQPPESALGATVLAVRMGRSLGLSEAELAETYYASVTRFVGCSSTAMEGAQFAVGHDRALNYALSMCDWTDPDAVEASLERHLTYEVSEGERRSAIQAIRAAVPMIPDLAGVHCAQALALVSGLSLPEGVARLLGHMYARWDGKIAGASGEAIPLAARVIALAVSAELYRRVGGVASVVEMARLRAGAQYDPRLCALLERDATHLFAGFGANSIWGLYLDSEPGTARMLDTAGMRKTAQAFADFADHKSGWLLGHSRRVAGLALRGAEALRIAGAEREDLYLAALVHDVGRAGVANGTWDKPGSLTAIEVRQAQSHSYQTESVLSLATAFASVRDIAAAAHERIDGSGYHRGTRGHDPRAGLLAAADVYDALTHDRPWRAAYDAARAADLLLAETKAGRLHREAARAILDTAGHGRRASQQVYPAGLSSREAEILVLLARGASTKAIADALGISPKTADHHVQRVYEKTGARGRPAAALYALRHGFVPE